MPGTRCVGCPLSSTPSMLLKALPQTLAQCPMRARRVASSAQHSSQASTETDDLMHRQRAGAQAALLSAAEDQRLQRARAARH